jgi:hypothetical protein
MAESKILPNVKNAKGLSGVQATSNESGEMQKEGAARNFSWQPLL